MNKDLNNYYWAIKYLKMFLFVADIICCWFLSVFFSAKDFIAGRLMNINDFLLKTNKLSAKICRKKTN